MPLTTKYKNMQIGYKLNNDNVKNLYNEKSPKIQKNKNIDMKPNTTESYCVFHIEGGLGKNVAATSVVSLMKRKYPNRKLVVVASYPEIFLNNPNIHRVYRIGNTPYFYDDYIKDKDTLIFKHEPYFQTDHILKKKSLIQNWAELYNLEYDSTVGPEIYMNFIQLDTAARWVRNRPVMVIQTNGGPMFDQKYNYAWTRDMPYGVASAIVDRYKNDYHIIQICRNETQVLPNVEAVFEPMSAMELFSLLRVSKKRVLIDSSLQHASAAFKLPSTVLWVGTSPIVFGYNLHKNIIANQPPDIVKLVDSYLFDYQFNGELHECPYMNVNDMFDLNKIFETLD